jgi:beta-lactamase class A
MAEEQQPMTEIERLIDEVSRDLTCDYAIYYRPLGGEAVLRQNCERFLSASMIKVPILFAWAHLQRAGAVSLSETCNLDTERQVEGAGLSWMLHRRTLPYHDVLLLMIALSDNLCTNLVIQHVGLERLNRTFRELGLPDAALERKLFDYEARARGLHNWVSVGDCIRLFELRDALAPEETAWIEPMLMWNTDSGLWLRNIPRDTIDFYHKTGNIEGVLHDWGYTREADVFILTQNVRDEREVYKALDRLGPALLGVQTRGERN